MGDMSQASLVADHKAGLMKSAERFGDADFPRHLLMAADDLQRLAPDAARSTLTLVTGQSLYDAPADLVRPLRLLWGEHERALPPWDPAFPGRIPTLGAIVDGGVRKLHLSPAPSYELVARLGSSAPYSYVRRYLVAEAAEATTVPVHRRTLLLVLAAAYAMQELANRSVYEPVRIGDGLGQAAKNGTPAALAEQLRRQAEAMAA
jgi:hypothetical protein